MRWHRPRLRPKNTVTMCSKKKKKNAGKERVDIRKSLTSWKFKYFHSQGDHTYSSHLALVLCQRWRKVCLNPLPFWCRGKETPGRGCVFTLALALRRMVQLAEEMPRTTAGELQSLAESWGQKVSKTLIRCHLHQPQVVWLCCQQQTEAATVCKRYWDFQCDRVIWSDDIK